jgi:RNA polymerase sigma-70 factor (ECF subfamily)
MTGRETELRALMIAGLAGDAAAHRALLHGLSRQLRGYFRSRLARVGRDTAEADDLVQETLMAIHTRRHTYDPAEPLTPWVHAIARYKLIDHLRRTQSRPDGVPLAEAEDLIAADDHVGADSAHDLDRLLSRLPAAMRRAIRAVKLDGLSVAEAASRFGMSESAVRVNVHRGLKALAAALARKPQE